MTTNKPEALELARRTIRQLSNAERDRILEQYLSDGIAVDKARIAELEAALIGVREQPAPAVRGEPVACEVVERAYHESYGNGVRLKLYIYAHQWPITEPIPIGTKLYFNPQPAEQQPAPDVTQLVDALCRCLHQANYSIGCEDALKAQLEKVREIANDALSAYHKQGVEP